MTRAPLSPTDRIRLRRIAVLLDHEAETYLAGFTVVIDGKRIWDNDADFAQARYLRLHYSADWVRGLVATSDRREKLAASSS